MLQNWTLDLLLHLCSLLQNWTLDLLLHLDCFASERNCKSATVFKRGFCLLFELSCRSTFWQYCYTCLDHDCGVLWYLYLVRVSCFWVLNFPWVLTEVAWKLYQTVARDHTLIRTSFILSINTRSISYVVVSCFRGKATARYAPNLLLFEGSDLSYSPCCYAYKVCFRLDFRSTVMLMKFASE